MPVALSGCRTTPVDDLCFSQSVRAYGFSGHQCEDGSLFLSAGANALVRHELSLRSMADLRIWLPRLRANLRNVRLHLDLGGFARQLRDRAAWSPEHIPVGLEPEPDRKLMEGALHHIRRVIPQLGHARISRAWAGMIDMSPDALPILEGDAGPDGLVIATGFSGHGLMLAPVLGRALAGLLTGEPTEHALHNFRLDRFRDGNVPVPTSTL